MQEHGAGRIHPVTEREFPTNSEKHLIFFTSQCAFYCCSFCSQLLPYRAGSRAEVSDIAMMSISFSGTLSVFFFLTREKNPGIRHCDESSLSAAEVLTGMRNTLDKATNASRLWLVNNLFQSKQLLHNLETTLRTFIVDFEAQINVDSQQLEVN